MKSKKLLMYIIAFALLLCATFALSACGEDGDPSATITVTFVADEKEVLSKTITLGSELNKDDLPAVPDKTGYVGEWEMPDLKNITTDVTVNAKYTAKTYSLTFDYDGADTTDLPANKTVTYNQPIGELPAPTKTGNELIDWKIDGNKITSSTVWTIDGDKTAQANWIEVATDLEFTLSEDETYYIVSGIGAEKRTSFAIPSEYKGLPVKEIGEKAFRYCDNLKNVIMLNGITSIGSSAFSGCDSLTSVTIPNSVTSIGEDAFNYCSSLTKVNYTGTIDQWVQINFVDVYSNPLCCANNLYIDNKLVAEANITTATKINAYAFAGCISLTSITIPNNVTSIGDSAFIACISLTSVTIGNSVTSIGDSAFSMCLSLKSITILDSVTSIGDGAFGECFSLTSVTIGNSVTSIGKEAFQSCAHLPSITIPDSVTSIGDDAFIFCYQLVEVINYSSLEITKGSDDNGYVGYYALNIKTEGTSDIVNIDDYLFYTYDNVNYLLGYVGSDTALVLPDKYNGQNYEIYDYSFPGYLNVVTGGAMDNSITSITIPDGVTSIGSYAFYKCGNLTSITIPDSVTSIGEGAFYGCDNLASVTIGNSVTSIGKKAFEDCSSLASVTIGNSVESIGSYAFGECFKLVEVINNSKLNITKGSDDNGYVGYYALNIKTEGSSETINKDGYLFYTHDNVNYLLGYVGSDTDLVLPSNYNGQNYEIYKRAFCDSNITTITIPDGVTSIGNRAFYDCDSLTSVTIGNSVTSIGERAFERCSRLSSVYYTGTIDQWVQIDFYDSSSNPLDYANNLYIDNKLVTEANITTAPKINAYAFCNCSSLTSITIGNSVTSIGVSAFAGCSSLTSVTIGNSVKIIGDYAFDECSNLINVTIGNSVTNIRYGAFYRCSSLTSVTIGNSVTSIGEDAFSGCSSLTSVYYIGTAEQWANISISYNFNLTNATRYYYSETEPALNSEGTAYDGNYWHYVDGVPAVWSK